MNLNNIKSDLPASIVVFFLSLPLCLGIALASGAPLFSGLIAGIIGGIVVGSLSGSNIGVSGPAAGLAAIVLTAITALGGFENFLLAVVLGGIIQVLFGIVRAGVIGYYFPSSVIKGMLTGIGIIIILKQIPHFFGYDASAEGDFAFFQLDGENTFSGIWSTFQHISLGATLIAIIGLVILILWDQYLTKKSKVFQIIQGPLVAVFLGIIYVIASANNANWAISSEHLVNVPVASSFSELLSKFSSPNFSQISNPQIWITAFTIALVASLETLLCVEATDKLDPEKRVTPTNRELIAQGIGNITSGLIGGLPITQVIVRSSANIQSGGKTKLSAIVHGIFLLLAVVAIPTLLNKIPLSVLAAILFIVGFKLAKPALFKTMYMLGWDQFVPFIITVLGIIFTDLLVGIGLGLMVGILIILWNSFKNSHQLNIDDKLSDEGNSVTITLAEEVTFFNKSSIIKELESIPIDSRLIVDVSKSKFIDFDILSIFEDFKDKAKTKNISIVVKTAYDTLENPGTFYSLSTGRKRSA
jgi:MFS superfamily sulfate permease-like transporter